MTETPNTEAQIRPTAALDLNTLEREGGPKAVFDFVLRDRGYVLTDPQDVDWQRLLVSMDNPVHFFRLVLPADDHEAFFGSELPMWKMNVLMSRYQKHYDLPTSGEATGLPR